MKLVNNSSIRKLARAMRQGVVPDERQVIIDTAVKEAERRAYVYLNRPARHALEQVTIKPI